jgi:S1-C subfamily serine protease
VRSADDVVRMISSRVPGETLTVTVVRGEERKVLRAKLGARPDAPETNP